MLEHGGNLMKFAQQYQIPVSQWLDLSTGVSPHTYLCPSVPTDIWNRLPELNDGLEQLPPIIMVMSRCWRWQARRLPLWCCLLLLLNGEVVSV